MQPLPVAVHSVAQVRAIDRHAIDELHIPGYVLMQRAGGAALAALREHWPAAKHLLIACGVGNNAGDGYVLARLALAQDFKVTVVAYGAPEKLAGDARTAYRDFLASGGKTQNGNDPLPPAVDVIVDALFGTGLSRPLDAEWCRWIELLNSVGRPIFSLDVPSGLDADTGQIRGAAIRATRTIVFVGLKIGLFLGSGRDCSGTILFDDLAIPAAAVAPFERVASRLNADFLSGSLPPRRRTANKGNYGHVLLIAGGEGMAGAARLAGEACLRVGAGRVTVATRAANVTAIVAGRPELMVRAIEEQEPLRLLFEAIDLVAIGPGLGRDAWAQAVFEAAMTAGKPLVVDADALNLLALQPHRRDDWILTPHPGEAARLLGLTAREIQADRLAAAGMLADRYGGIAVLKGAGTLIARRGEIPALCDFGNPGMAAPGMGDVLTGVIAGLAVQMKDPWTAARAGVLVHALAGDAAAMKGERGVLAGDLFAHLQGQVNPVP